MAHIYRVNGRKPLAQGPITSVGYGNITHTGLSERKHITIMFGNAILRIEMTKAVELAHQILEYEKELP